MTREEFCATLQRYGLAVFGALPIESLHDAKDALLAAYDARGATITDLLVACEAALPIVCSRIEYPGDPCEKIADGIRAAIAKARGSDEQA